MCEALVHGQRICVALINNNERSVGIGFVRKLDQRCRVGGCTKRGRSREGHLDYTRLGSWG